MINNEVDDIYFIKYTIKIIDDGQGISEEGLKNLFVNFESLQEHQQKNQRGTGLGLSICKQIIEKMGGNIEVSSEVGKGTCFKINMISLCSLTKKNESKCESNIAIDSIANSMSDPASLQRFQVHESYTSLVLGQQLNHHSYNV